jgi:lysophospholipase L1-like esterase
MEWYEDEVRALERSRVRQARAWRPAVFYGSSTLRLWDSLAEDLGEPRALNLAFGGSTLAACVHFFDRLVRPVAPASLVVYAGDNDLGDGCSPEQVMASFERLSAKVADCQGELPFGFITIKPSPARAGILDRIRRTNDGIRARIERMPGAYVIDVFDAMVDAAGAPRRELFLDDGLHLSRDGYRLWIRLLEPYRHRIFTEN